jgi:hypothetical protein
MTVGGRVLNKVPELIAADNMPAKWQVLLRLGKIKFYRLKQRGIGSLFLFLATIL